MLIRLARHHLAKTRRFRFRRAKTLLRIHQSWSLQLRTTARVKRNLVRPKAVKTLIQFCLAMPIQILIVIVTVALY